MIMQINNLKIQHATGKLYRVNSVKTFKYEELEEGRKFRTEDPIEGYMSIKASVSIKTNDNLNFVKGDKILLEEDTEPLMVINFSKKTNQKQYMFLKENTSVTYILDLE